jgi:hypothetical protein
MKIPLPLRCAAVSSTAMKADELRAIQAPLKERYKTIRLLQW